MSALILCPRLVGASLFAPDLVLSDLVVVYLLHLLYLLLQLLKLLWAVPCWGGRRSHQSVQRTRNNRVLGHLHHLAPGGLLLWMLITPLALLLLRSVHPLGVLLPLRLLLLLLLQLPSGLLFLFTRPPLPLGI